MSNQRNSIEQRMIFENAKLALNEAFGDPNAAAKFKLTLSSLRLEQALVAGQTLYTFPVLTNDTALGIFNTEVRLKQQDSFVVAYAGYYIGLPSGATDTAWEFDTYPNPFKYGANAVPMKSLYNGQMIWTINNDKLVYNWRLSQHWMSPQTQQTAAAGAGSPIDEKALSVDGMVAMQPTITLIGTKDNLIQVQLAAAPASFSANSRLIIQLDGVNAQNSTNMS